MSLLRGKVYVPPTKYNGIPTSSAILGTPLPILIGQQRASWKLLWYGDFISKKAKQQGAGGSGLSKGGVQYVYAASVIGGVCMGPTTNLLGVWNSNGKYAVNTYAETTTVPGGGSPTYTPNNASIYLQDLGAGYQSAYSVTANDYGSPGSTTYSGNQRVPLAYTSSPTPAAGHYTVNGSNQYVFNSADTGKVVTVTYVAYQYHIIENEIDVAAAIVTVQYQTEFNSDLGVAYYPSGVALTPISGTPTVAGTYNPNGGNYKFAAADFGLGVVITYLYIDPNTDTNAPSTLNLTFFTGGLGQTPWSYLTSKHPGEDLGYSEVAYVASSGMYLGYSPVLPQLNFEILGAYPFGNGIPDSNPADAINGMLTNTAYKLNFPASFIDSSLLTGNSSARNQWTANNFFISVLLDTQSSLMSLIGSWCEAGQVYTSWDEGRLKFIPLCDTTAVANGATYTPPTQPVVDLDDNDFFPTAKQDPITITQAPWQNRWNRVGVRWAVRANDYNEDILQIQDEASVQQYGLMSEGAQDWQFITTESAAQFAANLRLQRLSAIYTTYRFILKSNFAFLSPGDVVTVTDGLLGTLGTMFGRTPVRITSMTDDPVAGIQIEAENFPWSVGASLLYNKQAQLPSNTNDGPQQDPGNTVPVIFEVPNRAQVWAGDTIYIFANGSQVNWGGCQVYVSFNGTDYTFYDVIDTPARLGITVGDFPVHADPDNVDTVTVNMQQSGAVLQSVTAADRDAFVTLSAIVSPGQAFSQTDDATVGTNLGTAGSTSPTPGSTGFTLVGTGTSIAGHAGSPAAWSNPTDVAGSSGYATSGALSALHYPGPSGRAPAYTSALLALMGANSFEIPTAGVGPVIGIQLSLSSYMIAVLSGVTDLTLTAQLTYNNQVFGSEATVWTSAVPGEPTSPTAFSVGSASDLSFWGLATSNPLTPTMMNDPSFGVILRGYTNTIGTITTQFAVNDVQLNITWAAGGGGVSTAWINPNNVGSSSLYASAPIPVGGSTQWLAATALSGAELPFGFILEGIIVTANAYVSAGSGSLSSSLFFSTQRIGSPKGLAITTTPTDIIFPVVGANDLWGAQDILTLDMLNSLLFGAAFSITGTAGSTAFLNNVRVTLIGTSDYNLELISYETATLTGQNTYALTSLRRGVYGSYPCDHPSAATFARLDQATFTYQVDPTFRGSTIYFKFLSFNAYGNQLQLLSNVTAYAVPIGGLSPGALDAGAMDPVTGLPTAALTTGTPGSPAYHIDSAVAAIHGTYGVQNIPPGSGLLGPTGPGAAAGIPTWQPLITGGGGTGSLVNLFVLLINSNTTAAAWDYLVANTAGGAFNVSFPKASLNPNVIVAVKKQSTDANAVTLLPFSGDTIELASSYVIGSQNALIFVSDGVSNWDIFSGTATGANDFYISIPARAGLYPASDELYYSKPVRKITFPVGLVGTNSGCRIAPTAAVQVTLLKNGVSIGTVNIAGGATTATITFTSAVTFDPTIPDSFSVTAPVTTDITFAGFWLDILATR